MPNIQTAAALLWGSQTRELAAEALDLVTYHIGTNDGAQTNAAVTAGTAALLNFILANTFPGTPVIIFHCWLRTKKTAIEAVINPSAFPSRVIMIDTTGWWITADASDALHPFGYVNLNQLAPQAAAAIHGVIEQPRGHVESSIFRRATWREASLSTPDKEPDTSLTGWRT